MPMIKNNRALSAYILLTLVPLLLIASYLFFFAKDRYVSDSTVIVKQVSEVDVGSTGGLGALLGVNNTSTEDAQFLRAYIQSRDLVELLDRKLDLRSNFVGTDDPIYHLSDDASIEELVEYYQKRVRVNLDEKTMMLRIETEGFTPEFALKLNREILAQSEQFINALSQRVAKEQLTFSEQQLQDANQQLAEARDALLQYQNTNEMFDPQAQAQAIATIINGLESNLAQLKTEERTLLSYLNPEAPQVVAIRSQITSLQTQIENEKSKLTSAKSSKLNRSAADFEALKADVVFKTDLYKIALGSLEKSRLEAVRKMKNVVVITSPLQAQDAVYPRRGYILLSAWLLLSTLFGIGYLIYTVIREHRE